MSLALKLPKDQVGSLRSRDVQLYLISRGWMADDEESSTAAMLFRHPAMGDAEILLPLRRDLGDYTLRMADVVHALAVRGLEIGFTPESRDVFLEPSRPASRSV